MQQCCGSGMFGPIFKELKNFLPKKLSLSSQKYGFGIRDPENTYSGSRIQGSKRHRIPDPDPQHWLAEKFLLCVNWVNAESSYLRQYWQQNFCKAYHYGYLNIKNFKIQNRSQQKLSTGTFRDFMLWILSYIVHCRPVSVCSNGLWRWWLMLEIQTGNPTVRCWWGPGRDRWTSARGIRSWSGPPLHHCPHTEYKGSKIVTLGCALQVNEKDQRSTGHL